MRNNNDFPVKIKALNTPHKQDWDNVLDVLWKFYAHYMAFEGLCSTSDVGRAVMMYIFYGLYKFKRTVRKKSTVVLKSIVHGLHFKLTNHRSRFARGVDENFSRFLAEYAKNPSWKLFFDDKGEHGTPPMLYLVTFEEGLRQSANNKFTLGDSVLRTRERWGNVSLWRKRECYITLIRFIRGRVTYQKWHNFLWDDFTERHALHVTFMKRHAPLCDGAKTHFLGHIQDPPEWEQPGHQLSRKCKSKPTTKKSNKKSSKMSAPDAPPPVPMRFDPASGCLVPYCDLTE